MGRGKSYWLLVIGYLGAEEEAEFSQAGTHVPSLRSGHAKSASRFLKLPLARQMHSQRSVCWGVIEEEAGSLAFLNMERDAPWTAWSKMLQLR
jgi:hypothetical protein